ncbi:glucose sorbosone dehydrogenase [Colletotrichum abscissum]|uniref:Glucose sorbosone dehydrogenase n=1 Tax=Colletotrichum abscissum TaxID=1671311 RepID=A0A9Q0BA08_9PEZI|nr:glucose sorbosone dehydrogenase [Colletotrichum abscissum]KAI3559639.1 glucose sorbosone dehydrogenase [Colletotrichum abscissum]KAK1486145.1 glucose sorbosone dehydrogenase [Colletotrichum abscissum]
MKGLTTAALAVAAATTALAQQCADIITPSYNAPQVAAGWQAQLVANGFKKPRTIHVDSEGALLVLDAAVGVYRVTFKDNGGTCLTLTESKLLVNNTKLTHGMAFSEDGKTLYASSVSQVLAWAYDAKAGTVNAEPAVVINNMANNDQTTRTLVMSKASSNWLVVSRGVDENFDIDALDANSGHAQVKAFDLSKSGNNPFDFNTDGKLLGWGIRNAVAVAEDPATGNVWAMDNSIDDITRNGVDIHANNPGEELNLLGTIANETDASNYGYPRCFAVWDTSIPLNSSLNVGDQFSMEQNSTMNDTRCHNDYVAPLLTFQSHSSPVFLKFNDDGSKAFVSFRGSFNRPNPVGYALTAVDFSNGEPVAKSDSTDALKNIMYNKDLSTCPDQCFRPVGLAWDSKNRLFMTSDSTGEIYILQQTDATPTSTTPGTIVTGTATSTAKPDAASGFAPSLGLGFAALLAATFFSF